ncbi:hypothetical protein SprV_0200547900 [Sparganum proliferum]
MSWRAFVRLWVVSDCWKRSSSGQQLLASQLTSFITCLRGHNVDDFVKRIFFALFDDEINIRVNFKGRETRESLSEFKFHEVIVGLQRLEYKRQQKTQLIRWKHSRNVFR